VPDKYSIAGQYTGQHKAGLYSTLQYCIVHILYFYFYNVSTIVRMVSLETTGRRVPTEGGSITCCSNLMKLELCWEEGTSAERSTFDGMPQMKALKKRTRRGVRTPGSSAQRSEPG